MSNIATRLEAAVQRFEQYLGADATAESRQLGVSMRVAISAIDGTIELPRHHVLQTVRTFVGELEVTDLPAYTVDEARNAYGALCLLWGFRLVEGPLYVHAAQRA